MYLTYLQKHLAAASAAVRCLFVISLRRGRRRVPRLRSLRSPAARRRSPAQGRARGCTCGFVHADGQERNDHDRDAEITAVTIAVLDDVREAGHGNGHGQNDDERGHDGAAHRRGLDAAEHRQLLKAGNEAEDRRHARGDEAEHEADAVNCGERADAHGVADRERGDGRAAVHGGVDAAPADEHEHGEHERNSVHGKGDPHGLGTALLAAHGRAAGDHGRERDALEAGIGEGVKDGLGDVGKAGRSEVRGKHREQRRLALEDADGVDGDGSDEDGDAHIGGCCADDAGAENGQEQDEAADGHDAEIIVHTEIAPQRGGRARDGRRDGHEHHDVEKDLEQPLNFVKGVVERLEQLLIARQAAGIVHDHSLAHREREQQHGHDGRHDAGPAEADVIGVGLVAGREAAACVRGKQHRADREGGKKRGLGYGSGFGPGFHDSFLLQKRSLMVWQEKRKPSVFPALWQKRRKAENPPRYHSSSPPIRGRTHSGYHHIPAQ